MFGKISLKEKSNVFTLGERILLLNQSDSIIIPQVAEMEGLVITFIQLLIIV